MELQGQSLLELFAPQAFLVSQGPTAVPLKGSLILGFVLEIPEQQQAFSLLLSFELEFKAVFDLDDTACDCVSSCACCSKDYFICC